jgi:hypothetical protein
MLGAASAVTSTALTRRSVTAAELEPRDVGFSVVVLELRRVVQPTDS